MDTASQTYGDGFDICGARTVSIAHNDGSTDITGFLSESSGVLTLSTTDLTIVGNSYLIKVTVTLDSYPARPAFEKTFTATINACIITAITPTAAITDPILYTANDAKVVATYD